MQVLICKILNKENSDIVYTVFKFRVTQCLFTGYGGWSQLEEAVQALYDDASSAEIVVIENVWACYEVYDDNALVENYCGYLFKYNTSSESVDQFIMIEINEDAESKRVDVYPITEETFIESIEIVHDEATWDDLGETKEQGGHELLYDYGEVSNTRINAILDDLS